MTQVLRSATGYLLHPYGFPEDTPNQLMTFFGFPTASHPRIVSSSEAGFRCGPAGKNEEGHQRVAPAGRDSPPQGAGLHPSDSAIISHTLFPSQISSPYHVWLLGLAVVIPALTALLHR